LIPQINITKGISFPVAEIHSLTLRTQTKAEEN